MLTHPRCVVTSPPHLLVVHILFGPTVRASIVPDHDAGLLEIGAEGTWSTFNSLSFFSFFGKVPCVPHDIFRIDVL